MKSQIPTSLSALRSTAQSAITGCEKLETQVGLMHNTATTVGAALDKLDGKQADLNQAGQVVADAHQANQGFNDAAYEYIQTSARVLRKFLGNQFNHRWLSTGFPGNSTAVPASPDDRMVLVRQLQRYFEANPAHENEKQEVTADLADKLHEKLVKARQDAKDSEAAETLAKTQRDNAKNGLRTILQNLVDELDLLLPNTDPRWKQFGFEIPAERPAPETPAKPTVNNGLPGKLLVTCPPVSGVDHYRFWLQEAGSAAGPVAVGSSNEPQFLIDDVAASKAFKVFTSVVNGAGKESKLSEPVEAVVTAKS